MCQPCHATHCNTWVVAMNMLSNNEDYAKSVCEMEISWGISWLLRWAGGRCVASNLQLPCPINYAVADHDDGCDSRSCRDHRQPIPLSSIIAMSTSHTARAAAMMAIIQNMSAVFHVKHIC